MARKRLKDLKVGDLVWCVANKLNSEKIELLSLIVYSIESEYLGGPVTVKASATKPHVNKVISVTKVGVTALNIGQSEISQLNKTNLECVMFLDEEMAREVYQRKRLEKYNKLTSSGHG